MWAGRACAFDRCRPATAAPGARRGGRARTRTAPCGSPRTPWTWTGRRRPTGARSCPAPAAAAGSAGPPRSRRAAAGPLALALRPFGHRPTEPVSATRVGMAPPPVRRNAHSAPTPPRGAARRGPVVTDAVGAHSAGRLPVLTSTGASGATRSAGTGPPRRRLWFSAQTRTLEFRHTVSAQSASGRMRPATAGRQLLTAQWGGAGDLGRAAWGGRGGGGSATTRATGKR